MSIVKMSKLRLVGLLSNRDKVLDEISLQNCAHLKQVDEITNLKRTDTSLELENLKLDTKKAEKVILSLSNLVLDDNNLIDCTYNDFFNIKPNDYNKISSIVDTMYDYLMQIEQNYNLIIKYKRDQIEMLPFDIKKLLQTSIKVPKAKEKLKDEKIRNVLDKIYKVLLQIDENEDIANLDNVSFKTDKNGELFAVFNLKQPDYESLVEKIALLKEVKAQSLQSGIYELYYSFKKSNPEVYEEYEQKIKNLNDKIESLENENLGIYRKLEQFCPLLNKIKIYADNLNYKIQKLKAESLMLETKSTFMMEVYVPKPQETEFISQLQEKFTDLVITKEKITSKDTPPTLIKANKVVQQADFVINMYSVPKYSDVDPTRSVFFFFMVFFGFIIADVGYGIVLALLGFMLGHRKKATQGSKRLWNLIGIGGLFAIVWGFLFGSVFGFSHEQWALIPAGIMPNPQKEPITLLLLCLLFGILQIAYGYILRGATYFKRGEYVLGVVNGIAWVLFLLGGLMAVAKFMLDFFNLSTSTGFYNVLTQIQTPGLIIMLVGLGVGILFAGIGTKGFRKFTKSFSAAYGIVSLFSDVLSYTRLFGLMLSSAIIAQQFNSIALGLMTSPLGYIMGFVIILVGHSFNVAMGTLSAYIHDVRLQYVEYFGKFYQGEGIQFHPMKIETKYISLVN